MDTVNMNNPILSDVIDYDSMNNITKQFSRLKEHCYLDNTGAALYPQSLIKKVSDDFINNIYMNPHSDIQSLKYIEGVRELILQHFNTSSSEYSVIFTSGATQALKLVVESFQFGYESNKRGAFVHLCDNHTSILGLRELVNINEVDIFHITHEDFLETLSYNDTNTFDGDSPMKTGNALFIYPAQNNFNGFKYPINCMSDIKRGCLNKCLNRTEAEDNYNWKILLDVASFVSTSRLNLSVVKPDFVCLSFYKIFGYPTGLGALLVRNNCISLLSERKYYGGGTVDTVLNTETFFARKKDISEGFEDGTISFLSIMALRHCFEILNNLIPKAVHNNIMDTISYHTYYLAKELYIRLKELKHQNGRKAIIFYMDSDFTDIKKQGGIVTFNIIREDGSFVGYKEFERNCVLHKICIRTGCFCNSGSCQRHFKLSNKEIKDRYEAGHKCGGETDLLDGVPTGAVRVSFGYYNTKGDLDKIIDITSQSYLKTYNNNIESIPINKIKLQLSKQINHEDDIIKENYSNIIKRKPIFSLKEIIIYPIEHCGPYIIKSSWILCNKGLVYNNNWKIIGSNGTVLKQDHIRSMSKINPEIDLNYNNMILHMQGMNSISISLDAHLLYRPNVDGDKIVEHDCGDNVASWISQAVKCPNLRLVKISNGRNTNKVNNDLDLLHEQKRIIVINKPTINQSTEQILESILPINEASLLNSIRGNLVVDMPQESFTGDWDRIIIGNNEFKVEGKYTQNIKVLVDHKNNIHTHLSKDLVIAIFVRYVKIINDSPKSLVVNSQINVIKMDTTINKKMNGDVNSNRDITLSKESRNNFTHKLKHLLRKNKKKYEISEL